MSTSIAIILEHSVIDSGLTLSFLAPFASNPIPVSSSWLNKPIERGLCSFMHHPKMGSPGMPSYDSIAKVSGLPKSSVAFFAEGCLLPAYTPPAPLSQKNNTKADQLNLGVIGKTVLLVKRCYW